MPPTPQATMPSALIIGVWLSVPTRVSGTSRGRAPGLRLTLTTVEQRPLLLARTGESTLVDAERRFHDGVRFQRDTKAVAEIVRIGRGEDRQECPAVPWQPLDPALLRHPVQDVQ